MFPYIICSFDRDVDDVNIKGGNASFCYSKFICLREFMLIRDVYRGKQD